MMMTMTMMIPSSLRNDCNSDNNIVFWFSKALLDDDDNEISICSNSFVS